MRDLPFFVPKNGFAGIAYDPLPARLSEMEEYKGLSEQDLQDIAYDETIAEMSETILTDTDAAQRLSRQIYKQDKGLWEKIKDFFTGLVEKLRNAYRDSDPDSEIGRLLKRAVQDNTEIAQAWADAVAEAGENYQLQDWQISKSVTGDVRHSLRRNGELQEKADKQNQKSGYVSDRVMAEAAEVRNAIAKIMLDPELQESMGLPADVEGNTFFPDSSYGGTEENTTICPRSMGAEALLDAVSDLIGRPLTVDEQIIVSQEMQNLTANPECVYCYVATDRKAYRDFLGNYIEQRDWVVKNAARYSDTKTYSQEQVAGMTEKEKQDSLYVRFLNGRKATKNMASRYNQWLNLSRSGKPMLQASDLTSISRLEALRAENFKGISKDMAAQIKDAMRYAQSASWAKKRVGYTAYNGHILGWKQSRIDSLNSQYGLRMYSFSDFSPAFILENMQMVTDAATKGLKMLAYTKDMNFVKIFAKTGMNINVSCFGFEVGGNVYENNLQGANWAEAQKLRAENPNVGVVFVTYNDAMTKWAMRQDWVDVVIPYHLVRTGTKVAEAFGFTNYTDISGDKKITESWVKGQDEAHITPPMHENNLEKYLKACEENHLTPRFQKFLDDPSMRPYYMKLVNETRRSAQDTPTVQPVFNQRAAEAALADMRREGGYFQPIGGSVDRMVDIALEISEKLQNRQLQDGQKKNAREGVRYSVRNNAAQYDYSKSFEEQVEDYKSGLIPKGDTLLVGKTPEVFLGIGMNALPVTINTTHVDYALNGTKDFDHHLGEALLKQLPEAIKKPVAIMTSGTKNGSSIVAMLEVRHNGKQVIMPVAIDGFGKQNGIVIDSNAITSIYGKNNSISKVLSDAISQENNGQFKLFYLDENKATALLQEARVPMPKNPATHDGGFIHSITDSNSPVKQKIGSVTESQQFKRWFGDWQNDPANASKVVNGDGTPKRLYRYTNLEDTVIKPDYRGAIWMADNDWVTSQYGNRNDVLYANIRNPYVHNVTGTDFSEETALVNARKGGHDGLVINFMFTGENNSYYKFMLENVPDTNAQGVLSSIVGNSEGLAKQNETISEFDRRMKENGNIGYSYYAVFDQKNVKSATDNIGTFDKNSPDIRFSDRNSQSRQVERLERKNAELKAQAEYLRQVVKIQKSGNKAHILDRNSVNAIGKGLMESVNAKGSEFGKVLNDFYRALGTEDMSYEAMQDRAGELADWLLEHHLHPTDPMLYS